MFQVKICGVTVPDDAWCCSEVGADAIGLNFYPASPRYVSPSTARRIVADLPSSLVKVGVFVNAVEDEIVRACGEVGLDAVQLHGDETPHMVARLADRRVIKAFRCAGQASPGVVDFLRQCRDLGAQPYGVLIDAAYPGVYGGTGQTADWPLVRDLSGRTGGSPVILAGGLRPDNVAAAVETARPDAVDTASGVESSPGCKDARLVADFIRNARDALERIQRLLNLPGCSAAWRSA